MVSYSEGDSQKVLLPSTASKLRINTASVPNFSRVLQGRIQNAATIQPHRIRSLGQDNNLRLRQTKNVMRWDPQSKTFLLWDGLRRDEELWFQGEDSYYIHLYGQGRSKRGPSFRVPRTDIDAMRCDLALTGASSTPGSSEIFIAAPENAQREDTFKWHVTTRNLFAWMTMKPLVGTTLGEAFIDLLSRMRLCRPLVNNTSDLISYAKNMGYMEFSHNPDYALAFLSFAEHYRLKDIWTDAFSHCVGMSETLQSSTEYAAISQVTKALISRAYLEMDLHLGRVSCALKTFLEDELSPYNFGLPAGAQAHLERFRSFLHSFYVNQFGYWPPENNYILSKSLLRSMHDEFRALYEFLVDRTSSEFTHGQSVPASGGICVLQNIAAFNKRHSYEPLAHSLPLLPACKSTQRTQSQRGLRTFKLGTKSAAESPFEKGMSMRSALAMATNSAESDVKDCPLIKSYIRFEQEWSVQPKEKLSVTEARKVRWIVIYTALQMLTSVVRTPKEVRQTELASYHMCLLTAGTPTWGVEESDVAALAIKPDGAEPHVEANAMDAYSAIKPDCEVLSQSHKRIDSGISLRPAPLRISTTGSINRFSSMTSNSKRIQSRGSISPLRNSMILPSRNSSVSTYDSGNGLSSTSMQRRERGPLSREAPSGPQEQTFRLLQPKELEDLTHEAEAPVLDLSMLTSSNTTDLSSDLYSSASPTSSVSTAMSSWPFDDADTFSWSSGDESTTKRNSKSSRGIYSMEHESVYSTGDSVRKLNFSSSSTTSSSSSSNPGTPSVMSSRSASGYFSSSSSSFSPVSKASSSPHAAEAAAAEYAAHIYSSFDYSDYEYFEEPPRGGDEADEEGEELPGLNAQFDFDLHQALELLPSCVSAQAS